MAYHVPVLLREALELLAVGPGDVAVDLTVGGGGYARALLERVGPTGRVIGIDQDEEAILEASERLAGFPNFLAVKGNFRDLGDLLDGCGVEEADRIVMDLGVSSHQLDAAERGFSFRQDAPLDMRMDRSRGRTAADLLAELDQGELTRLIREYGEERFASSIARAVV
ncbi:MAG: 16S rRNA (cytosine(1402)-N(4))-methyltransferase RsmH, partial [Candidatus Eremiobacterota bacterium]